MVADDKENRVGMGNMRFEDADADEASRYIYIHSRPHHPDNLQGWEAPTVWRLDGGSCMQVTNDKGHSGMRL